MSQPTGRGNWNPISIAQNMVRAVRLLADPQVPMMLKIALPGFALLYWISPIDLLPMIPLDDIAVVMLALNLFVQAASDPRVRTTASNSASNSTPGDDYRTVDGTWSVVDGDE